MATTKGPLMSLDASGALADTIVFSKWKGRNYVRQHVIPSNPRTGLQVGVRAVMRFVTQSYAALSATIKGHWADEAATDNITPLNAMVRVNQERGRQDKGIKKDPTFAEGASEAAPVGPAAAAQPRSLKLTWTDSIGADDWATAVYSSPTGVVTPGPATLIRIVPRGDQSLVVTDLVTGTTYHFKLRGIETGGTLGTATADFTGVPS